MKIKKFNLSIWPNVSVEKIIYKRNFDDHRKKIFESTTLKNMYNSVD